MTNLQIVGLCGGIGIVAGVALAYDQHRKRKREQELFRFNIAHLEERCSDLEQMHAESISRLHGKDEQVRVLLQENLSLKERDTEAPWQTFA